MRKLRPRLTYANVASSLALFLAVSGGTAIAAATIGTKDIKNGAVTTSKIANGAVTGAKVKNGSLTAADFAPGSLPAGPQGPQGPQGPPGPPATQVNGVVSPTGQLVYGKGVAAVSVAGSGVYTVTFNQNVSECPAVATVGGYQLGGVTASGSDGGTVSLQPGGNNNAVAATQITFITRGLNGVNTPLPFHFAVFC
ncbi:MAG: hypothetical protein IRZ32_06785 [Solirubrobacteraceae bacterium]|nr:hypothetical protein [Solirubrobacteraceae bacterium]